MNLRNILVLCSLNPDATDCSGNVYPESGYVQAGVFFANSNILHGLYGVAWADYSTEQWLNTDSDAVWCVVKVDKSTDIISIDEDENLVKFRSGNVILTGSRYECEGYIEERRSEFGFRPSLFRRPSLSPDVGPSSQSYDDDC